jgi:tetratricopeptide (TPR) repeat protein
MINLIYKNCFIFAISGVILFIYSYSVTAKEDAYLLDTDTYSALTEIHKDMENGSNNEALKKLNILASTDKLKNYDAAVIYQTMGYVESAVGNFEQAAKHFKKALSLNALPKEVVHELNYSTAQLLIHIEKPKEGLGYLSKWFANELQPKADAHILAATAYYYIEDYKQLVVHSEKALLLNKKPPLNWHELLLAGYYETKDYKGASITLEKIVNQYPEKTDYWLQLAGVYQRLDLDKKALAIYELAYTKNLLKKEDIIQFIKNYLYLEMPYKAATVLEKEMAIGDIEANKEMLTMLVDSWLLAQEYEKAIPVFSEIINKYNDDNTRLRLGQLYLESEEWKKAIEVLDVKLQIENKTLSSKINLLLGIAEYHSENLSKATQAFNQALSDKSTEEQAKWWLEHLKKKTKSEQQS